MGNRFQCVGLVGKYADPSVAGTLTAVRDYLRGQSVRVILDEATAQVWHEHDMEVGTREAIGRQCDLTIVVGGDGTMLNVARSLASYHNPALLGINLGRLGFLADISPDALAEKLGPILEGHYEEESRFLLHCAVYREGEAISESDALNDVVIHKWDVARMISIDTLVDGHFVNTVSADGLIVSTPTGSTAYALSGGGPILAPTLDAIVIVPICPHTLSNRPIVVSGESKLDVIVSDRYGNAHAQVTCDGQINLGLVSGDRIRIRKKESGVRLIHPIGHDHFEIIRAKLGWG